MTSGEGAGELKSYVDIGELIGGDEALAFVAQAAAMYQGWAVRNGFAATVVAREPSWAREGFHRRVRLMIAGADTAALGARESGVHSLVRMVEGTSRRHMAFIGVRVSDRPDLPWPEGGDAWGEQIRKFVMDPDPVVLNRITGGKSDKPAEVLEGHLELIWSAAP